MQDMSKDSKESKDTEKKSMASALLEPAKEYAVLFGKSFGVPCLMWLFGYCGFSCAWILLGAVLYVSQTRYLEVLRERQERFQMRATDEKKFLLQVQELPCWVNFPDVARVEWMNKIIHQMWPFISEYIEITTRKAVKTYAGVKELELGTSPPRIDGVKVYTSAVKRNEIVMDCEISWATNSSVKLSIKGISVGVKDIQIHGYLRLTMVPLLSEMPLIGGIRACFLNPPHIDFNLTDAANVADLPGVRKMVRGTLSDVVSHLLVLPNFLYTPLTTVDLRNCKYPPPRGVLRVAVIEGTELLAADQRLRGGKSDPYVRLQVGSEIVETDVQSNTLEPVWNKVFEFVIKSTGQTADVSVYDSDKLGPDKDDLLGRTSFDLETLLEKKSIDQWFELEDVTTGDLHMQLTWCELSEERAIIQKNTEISLEDDPLSDQYSSALLVVFIDSAKELPEPDALEQDETSGTVSYTYSGGKKALQEPAAQAIIRFGNTRHNTAIASKTTDPAWEEQFCILLRGDPELSKLLVEIKDQGKKPIGDVSIPLSSVLNAPALTLDRTWRLNNSGPKSEISMQLRIYALQAVPVNVQGVRGACAEALGAALVEQGALAAGMANITAAETAHKGAVAADALEIGKALGASFADQRAIATGVANVGVDSDKTLEANNNVSGDGAPSGSSSIRRRTTGADNDVANGSVGNKGKFGRVQLAFHYYTTKKLLTVVLNQCQGLPLVETKLPDAYAKVRLVGGKGETLATNKTDVIDNDQNPNFSEKFEFALVPTSLPKVSFELVVRNKTGFLSSSPKYIGRVTVPLSGVTPDKALDKWYDLQEVHSAEKKGK